MRLRRFLLAWLLSMGVVFGYGSALGLLPAHDHPCHADAPAQQVPAQAPPQTPVPRAP